MMKQKQAYIAYTIIVERDDGTPMFLIDNDETYFGFPAVESIKNQSGLSIIIDELKRTLKNIDFGRIELSELTNLVIEDNRIPFFVLKYQCGNVSPKDLLLESSTLEWQLSDNIYETLQQYDISGVPLF